MADKPAQGKGGKGGKGKLLLIVLAVVLLLGAGGGGAAWWFLLRKPHAPSPAQLAARRLASVHFIVLAPFVTNLASSDGSTHYLQTTVALKTSEPELDARISALTPELRNAILRLLASEPADKAASVQVREQLRQQIGHAVNRVLGAGPSAAGGPVSGVYFTAYVVQ